MAEPDVKYVVTEILMVAAKHCKAEILPEAVEYWFEHYTNTVTAARQKYPDLDWSNDRRRVLIEAHRLGITANQLAVSGVVTKTVAESASDTVTCPAAADKGPLWKYCEKAPDGE